MTDNLNTKIEQYKNLLNSGDTDAYYLLGRLFTFGASYDSDYIKGYNYFLSGATLDNPKCLYGLGMCYDFGFGVEANGTLSSAYYSKAYDKIISLATRGDAIGQYLTGCYYYFKSHALNAEVRKSCEQKFDDVLKKELLKGKTDIIFNNSVIVKTNAVYDCFIDDAPQNSDGEQSYLGKALLVNALIQFETVDDKPSVMPDISFNKNDSCGEEKDYSNIPHNKEIAFSYFLKASEQGICDATYMLAMCYLNGDGVRRNETEAKKQLFLAAETGSIKAAEYLEKNKISIANLTETIAKVSANKNDFWKDDDEKFWDEEEDDEDEEDEDEEDEDDYYWDDNDDDEEDEDDDEDEDEDEEDEDIIELNQLLRDDDDYDDDVNDDEDDDDDDKITDYDNKLNQLLIEIAEMKRQLSKKKKK